LPVVNLCREDAEAAFAAWMKSPMKVEY